MARMRIALLCLFALALAGCDKCGDYYLVNPMAPHSCKEEPAMK